MSLNRVEEGGAITDAVCNPRHTIFREAPLVVRVTVGPVGLPQHALQVHACDRMTRQEARRTGGRAQRITCEVTTTKRLMASSRLSPASIIPSTICAQTPRPGDSPHVSRVIRSWSDSQKGEKKGKREKKKKNSIVQVSCSHLQILPLHTAPAGL